MRVTIEKDGESETLDVHAVEHDEKQYDDDGPHEPGDEFWVVKGLQPDDTDLIPSRFMWLSGSLGHPMSDEKAKEFPLVYIPKDSEVEVSFDE